MKIKYFSIFFLLSFLFFPYQLIGQTSSFEYSISFSKDTAVINEPIELNILILYNYKKHQLRVNSIRFPQLHWIENQGTGISISMMNDSIKSIRINTKLKFLQTGKYVINSILIFYSLDEQEKNMVLNSPEIRIIDSKESWKSYFTPSFIISSTVFLVVLIFLVQMLVRYVYLKTKNGNLNMTENDSGSGYVEKLRKLLLDRRLNYKKNTEQLSAILDAFSQSGHKYDEALLKSLKEEIQHLMEKQFITFREFERIYQQAYQLMVSVKEQTKGGSNAGYSANQ